MSSKLIRSSLVLRGGLGNILFQLAAGLKAKTDFGHQIQVLGGYSKPMLRDIKLLELVRYLCRTFEFSLSTGKEVPLSLRAASFQLFCGQAVSDGDTFFHTKASTASLLMGYFQSWPEFGRQIEIVGQKVRHYFQLEPGKQHGLGHSMHIRLGDYKNHSKIYGATSARYLSQAIERLEEVAGATNAPFRVFTDDKQGATSLLKEINLKWKIESQGDTLTDFRNLASSSAIVGSNSTFSWWAAVAGDFIPLTLPRPFALDSRVNSKIRLNSKNVIWIDRDDEWD